MPRELTFEALVPGCSAKEFFHIACSDSTAITRFHKEVNKDDSVVAGEWGDERTRTVSFTLSMAIPPAVQRFMGAGPVRIKERQAYQWADEDTLLIESVPVVQISLAKSLVTRASLRISTTPAGCHIGVTVGVSASVPWPMQGTVESLMADEARRTVGQYVDFITQYVEDALNNQQQQQQQQQQEQQEQQEQPATPPPQQQHQPAEQLAAAKQPAAAAQPQQIWVSATAADLHPAPPGALPPLPPPPQQQQQLAPSDGDVFYDAQEVLGVRSDVAEALLRELKLAQEARQEANRLLLSIKDSLQQVERTVAREAAFQEGVRYGQRLGGGTLLLSAAAAAAAASAATAYVLMRRSAAK